MSALVDALEFLFPYGDLLAFSKFSVTPWFIMGIVFYFSTSAIYLSRRLRFLGRKLDSFSFVSPVKEIEGDKLFGEFWWRYKQSFLGQDDPKQKTELDAADVFDELSVISKHVSFRYWNSVPGILLSLGIFGTFLGLTLGIANFDASTPGTIQSSIQSLLAGMGTAFLTSLWGMACSISFNVIEKALFNNVARKLSAFCAVLDRRYKLSRSELMQFEREDRERFFHDLLVSAANGKAVMPGELLQSLLNNSVQQTMAIEMFSKILSQSVQFSTENVELRERIKLTIEQTQGAGISEGELDNFLEELVRVSQHPEAQKWSVFNTVQI